MEIKYEQQITFFKRYYLILLINHTFYFVFFRNKLILAIHEQILVLETHHSLIKILLLNKLLVGIGI
jgi:hypothetical protein